MSFCANCGQSIQEAARFCASCGTEQSAIGSETVISRGPKCPTCGSTQVEKISLKSKIGSAALVGVFALGKISKTFKCNDCGYRW